MLVPGPSPKFFGTWTGDRPQGFTVDIELKLKLKLELELDLDQEVIVVSRCRNRFKKRCILVPGSKSNCIFLNRNLIYFFGGRAL